MDRDVEDLRAELNRLVGASPVDLDGLLTDAARVSREIDNAYRHEVDPDGLLTDAVRIIRELALRVSTLEKLCKFIDGGTQ